MEEFFRFHRLPLAVDVENGFDQNLKPKSEDCSNWSGLPERKKSIREIVSSPHMDFDPYWHPALKYFRREKLSVSKIRYTGLKITVKRILKMDPESSLIEISKDFARLGDTKAILNKHDKHFLFFMTRCFLLLVDKVPSRVQANLLLSKDILHPLFIGCLNYAMQPEVLALNTPWLPVYASKPEDVMCQTSFDWRDLELDQVPVWCHFFTRITCGKDFMFSQFVNCLLHAVATARMVC
ncbi:uncharacterized protein LOC132193555 [Neocloeon triangulifer]|uniref:uncharacterized protein LOC132193555 n=1 Tax=Neocloeon triangulifer TaxID=2078957 RepID=UPI00286F6689|nr:uncharacterized protein LOC132193555 [Neocloeon triangulifer]